MSCQSRGDPGVRRSIFCPPRLRTRCPPQLRSLSSRLVSSNCDLAVTTPPGGFWAPPCGPRPAHRYYGFSHLSTILATPGVPRLVRRGPTPPLPRQAGSNAGVGAADTSLCQAEREGATEMPSHGEGLDGHPQPGGGLAAIARPGMCQPRRVRGPGSAEKLGRHPKKLSFPQPAKVTRTPDRVRSLTPPAVVHREGRALAQGHTARKGRNRDLNSGCLVPVSRRRCPAPSQRALSDTTKHGAPHWKPEPRAGSAGVGP